jgi:hypothetical protein
MGDFYINRKRERERVGKKKIDITAHLSIVWFLITKSIIFVFK